MKTQTQEPVKQLKRLIKAAEKSGGRFILENILITRDHFTVTDGRVLIVEHHGHDLQGPALLHRDKIKLLQSKAMAIAVDKVAGTFTDTYCTVELTKDPADFPDVDKVKPARTFTLY